MKKSLLLYAFILALLFNVYTYMFLSKEVTFEQDRYKRVTTKLKDSLNSVQNKVADANYFSLEKTPEWFADKFGIFITSICFAHEINGSISPQMMGASSCNFFGMPCWRHRRQTAALYMRAC